MQSGGFLSRGYAIAGLKTSALRGLDDVDSPAAAVELHLPIDQGVERVVGALANPSTGVELCAHLADEDVARSNLLAAEPLHAAVLGIAVASVSARALAFFVCHGSSYSNG